MLLRNQTNECLICQKDILTGGSLFEQLLKTDVICPKCRRELKPQLKKLNYHGYHLTYGYVYNDFFRDCLVRYKDFYDEALAPIFLWPFINQLKKRFAAYQVVTIPSVAANKQARGFTHVSKMLQALNLPITDLLINLSDQPQKYKSAQQRAKITLALNSVVEANLSARKILLVDDVLTTGSSINQALSLLTTCERPIEIFIFALHPSQVLALKKPLLKKLHRLNKQIVG